MKYPQGIKLQEIPAYDFLFDLCQELPIFEPDGKNGPDFLVLGKVAVESTQIMQSYTVNGKKFNIETNYKRIYDAISEILNEFNVTYSGQTYFLNFSYSAELPRISPYKKQIHDFLNEYLVSGDCNFFSFSIGEKIEFTIFPGTPIEGRVFRIGASDCYEQGGNPESIYVCEINRCIEMKSKKTTKWENDYPQKWLILVDGIGFWDNQINRDQISSKINGLGEFSRVLVIGWDRELKHQFKQDNSW